LVIRMMQTDTKKELTTKFGDPISEEPFHWELRSSYKYSLVHARLREKSWVYTQGFFFYHIVIESRIVFNDIVKTICDYVSAM
jgi:hypothetical protein